MSVLLLFVAIFFMAVIYYSTAKKSKYGFTAFHLSYWEPCLGMGDTWQATIKLYPFDNTNNYPTEKTFEEVMSFLLNVVNTYSLKKEKDIAVIEQLMSLGSLKEIGTHNFNIFYLDSTEKWYASMNLNQGKLEWEDRNLSILLSQIKKDLNKEFLMRNT